MPTIESIMAGAAALALAASTPTVCANDVLSDQDLAEQLSALNPGSTSTQMLQAAEDYASEVGISVEEALSEAIDEAEGKQVDASASRPGGYQLYSGKGKTYSVGSASRKGDIFFTPSSTLGIAHGHVGIYVSTQSIVEALPSTGVRNVANSQVKVEQGAVKQYVKTSQSNRNKAADRAKRYVGRGYNYNFAFNRTENGSMNCSQVVWNAYRNTAGISIDADEGAGVYPVDIRDSGYTVTYKTF